MADPTSRVTSRRRHEWVYPDAPSPRLCRYCGKTEWEIGVSSQEIGFCNGFEPQSRHSLTTTLTARDRQSLTTALLLLEAYQAKYGWMWTEGLSGEDVAAAARRVVGHAE